MITARSATAPPIAKPIMLRVGNGIHPAGTRSVLSMGYLVSDDVSLSDDPSRSHAPCTNAEAVALKQRQARVKGGKRCRCEHLSQATDVSCWRDTAKL